MREWGTSIAFITGGGQGIGLGIARALADRGVRLALADRDEVALARSRDELAQVTTVETFRFDVRDREAFADAADQVESRLGPVDLLFNNAGIAPHPPVSAIRYEQWDLALGVNLTGVVNGIQTFVPRMIERGEGGYVVNTASGAGLVAGPNVLYTTAKFAVVGLSESLRQALSGYDIEVSVLCPGFVDTGILRNTPAPVRGGASEDAEAMLAAGVSPDRVGELVVAGMEAGALWIHTDDSMRPWVKMRMEGLLASMP